MAESSRSVWYDASNVRHTGSSVCWSGVKVTAGSKKNPKPILKGAGGEGLSGYVEGGKFCAIMGPSGAGKTTLLNALAGRRLPNFEGTVLVDGKEPDRRRIAFVMQEDVLCPTQTPREALMFSAGLRLPATVSLAEKRKLVEATLRELKLERCADTLVGDAVKRGISGGEKKRTSIGIELVVRPKVLFLDEPTSGLDSYAAYSVVENLRQLSAVGCTVLSTIHQPSSEVFGLFADVIFLSLGETFYSGAAADLPSSLAAHGLAPPPLSNPADHTMFLLQTKPVEELQRVAAELNKKSTAAASAAAAVDAPMTASFATMTVEPTKDCSMRKRLMVNAMPPSKPLMPKWIGFQSLSENSSGCRASPSSGNTRSIQRIASSIRAMNSVLKKQFFESRKHKLW